MALLEAHGPAADALTAQLDAIEPRLAGLPPHVRSAVKNRLRRLRDGGNCVISHAISDLVRPLTAAADPLAALAAGDELELFVDCTDHAAPRDRGNHRRPRRDARWVVGTVASRSPPAAAGGAPLLRVELAEDWAEAGTDQPPLRPGERRRAEPARTARWTGVDSHGRYCHYFRRPSLYFISVSPYRT